MAFSRLNTFVVGMANGRFRRAAARGQAHHRLLAEPVTRHLAGDTAPESTSDEVTELKADARQL